MNQTPESKSNIGPALTPQILPSSAEAYPTIGNSSALNSAAVEPQLTVLPTPESQTIAPAEFKLTTSEINPPLEINHSSSMSASIPDPITTLPNLETAQTLENYKVNATNQEVEDKPMTLEDHLNVVRQNLYVSQLTPEIEDLIIKYVDAYHTTLDYCLKTPAPEEEKVKELELLSGPINEIYNPNNSRLTDGNNYPVIELILNKVDEYAEGLEKGFTRIRMPANASASHPEEQQPILNTFGYLSVLFIFIATVVFSIALGYLLFILKK